MRTAPLSLRLSKDPQARAVLTYKSFPDGIPLHRHSFFEITLVVRGSARLATNDTVHILRAGDLICATPLDTHGFSPVQGASALHLYTFRFLSEIIPSELRQYIPTEGWPAVRHLDTDSFIAMKQLFSSLMPFAPSETLELTPFVRYSIGYLLLTTFNASGSHPAYNPAISAACMFIYENFSKPITLADVANHVHLVPTYLSQLFHAQMGTTLQDFLLQLRLRFAADLLAHTDTPIGTLAQEAGFRNYPYFSRAFKAKNGLSPEAFRLRAAEA